MDDNACRIDRQTIQRARALRHPQSPAEAKLWTRLRNSQIAGLKFRRQHPIGPYIADFCCPAQKLVVELDGETHTDREAHDRVRTEYLQMHGYRVVRFYNSDVYNNIQGLLEAIFIDCGGTPWTGIVAIAHEYVRTIHPHPQPLSLIWRGEIPRAIMFTFPRL